jgi:transcriptional regulator with GAF, ATPase, and Fis domain
MNPDIANLRGLQRDAKRLIEDLRQHEPTEDIVRRIEEELRAVENTRIEAVRVAEKIQRHQRTLEERQAQLSVLMDEQRLELQDLIHKLQQMYQTISNIMRVFQDTQNTIIKNLK